MRMRMLNGTAKHSRQPQREMNIQKPNANVLTNAPNGSNAKSQGGSCPHPYCRQDAACAYQN